MNMEHVDANRRFCNKLWNATRFVLFVNAQLDEKRPQTLPSSDRLTRLALARNYQVTLLIVPILSLRYVTVLYLLKPLYSDECRNCERHYEKRQHS